MSGAVGNRIVNNSGPSGGIWKYN